MNSNISEEQIIKAINNAKDGVKKYLDIMDIYHSKNISKDFDFRRKFNHFYRMMRRSKDFYDEYFAYLQLQKGKKVRFEETLSQFKKKFNRMEPSFSSKLVATIDPSLPVWDKFVLQNLNLKAPSSSSPDRQRLICEIYKEIDIKMKLILKSNEGKKYLKLFNRILPDTKISDMKKIDFILWQLR
jgi:hypothetical protein